MSLFIILYIRFTTTKEDVNYEIIAVFKSRVYYKSEKNVFRYYYFINAKNEKNIKNKNCILLYKYEKRKATISNECSFSITFLNFIKSVL